MAIEIDTAFVFIMDPLFLGSSKIKAVITGLNNFKNLTIHFTTH
jgi:hypothetical protein